MRDPNQPELGMGERVPHHGLHFSASQHPMFKQRRDGFATGQFIQIAGEIGTREIVAIVDAADGLTPDDGFATWGTGAALILNGVPLGGLGTLADRMVHVAEPFRVEVTMISMGDRPALCMVSISP